MRSISLLVLLEALCALQISGLTETHSQQPFAIMRAMPYTRKLLRIQKGTDDTDGKYPYVVAVLGVTKYRICTGTLLAPTWVLTAAHCTKGIYVQYGDMTMSGENITSKSDIKKFIPHPSYYAYKYMLRRHIYNDIGLMLITEIKLDQLGKLSGLDYQTTFGHKVEYAGYGLTNHSGKAYLEDQKKPLQLGDGMLLECHDLQMNLFYFPRICVAPACATRQSVMSGDSGGPIFNDGKIVGINVGVVHDLKVSIYTPISPYTAWIKQTMQH